MLFILMLDFSMKVTFAFHFTWATALHLSPDSHAQESSLVLFTSQVGSRDPGSVQEGLYNNNHIQSTQRPREQSKMFPPLSIGGSSTKPVTPSHDCHWRRV